MIGKAIKSILVSVVHTYPLTASQGYNLPLCTYQVISDRPENKQQGRAGVREVNIQLNVIATTYDAADTLAWSIITAMDRVSGSYGDETIKIIRHTGGPEDLYQEDADVYGKAIDFTIWLENDLST